MIRKNLCFQILVPLLSNQRNHEQWPVVVSQDVLRHVHSLKSNVFVISGQVKGKTLLPLPVGSDQVSEACEADERLVFYSKQNNSIMLCGGENLGSGLDSGFGQP